jgi:choline dehydrogenase-like flavoprotein
MHHYAVWPRLHAEDFGAREVWTGPPGSMHIMGGTIMGTNAANSVTNSYGQLHDIPNLVVAGPGLFPTSGGVNPTFTVHALAARSAERYRSASTTAPAPPSASPRA